MAARGRAKGAAPPRRDRRAPTIPAGHAIGAHMSIAGGLHRAIERAHVVGCAALQVFTKSSNQWAAKPLLEEDVRLWSEARARYLPGAPVIAHDSYLINLGSPDDALHEKSLAAFRDELLRCEALGISNLVFHPGAHMGAGEAACMDRIAAALDRLHRELPGLRVKATLEITAGQGSCIGHRFEHLRGILERVAAPERVAVCLDTCHLLAAGYDIRSPGGYRAVMDELDAVVGIGKVEAFHVNDSRKGLGSRVDRHAAIGAGEVGIEAFRCLVNDARFVGVPMVLETPKEPDEVEADTANLRALVECIGGGG